MVKRKKVERKKEVEVNWLQYFHSIQKVCPWSYKSYCEGRIKIIPFDEKILKLLEQSWNTESWDAIVYTASGKTVDELDLFVEDRNNKQSICEYLWSHPTHTKGGNNQSPYPIIIQQDRRFLNELRKKKWKY